MMRIPRVNGDRRLVDRSFEYVITPSGRRLATVLVECKCGRRSRVHVTDYRRTPARRCKSCASASRGAANRKQLRKQLEFNRLSWAEDEYARLLCAVHEGGMTRDEIAAHYGFSTVHILRIEEAALRKYAAAYAQLMGEREPEAMAWAA